MIASLVLVRDRDRQRPRMHPPQRRAHDRDDRDDRGPAARRWAASQVAKMEAAGKRLAAAGSDRPPALHGDHGDDDLEARALMDGELLRLGSGHPGGVGRASDGARACEPVWTGAAGGRGPRSRWCVPTATTWRSMPRSPRPLRQRAVRRGRRSRATRLVGRGAHDGCAGAGHRRAGDRRVRPRRRCAGALGFPVFSTGIAFPGAQKDGPGRIGERRGRGRRARSARATSSSATATASCVIPAEEIDAVRAAGEARAAKEIEYFDQLRSGKTTVDLLDLDTSSIIRNSPS